MKEVPEMSIPFPEYLEWELRDPIGLRNHMFETYGDICVQVIGDFKNYFLMHPDYAQVVFSEKQDDFINRHPLVVQGFEPILGKETLFVQNDPVRWQKLRNIALMSMDVASFFERYVNKSYEIGKTRVDSWADKYEDGAVVNFAHEIDCMVINFVNHSFFYYIDDRPEDVREMLYHVNGILAAKDTASDPKEWEAGEKKVLFDDAVNGFKDTYRRWVRKRIESGKKIDDFMGLMIHELSKTFTGEELIAEAAYHVGMGSVASLFTTSAALRFLLIELARRPDVANKVREEIEGIVGDKKPTYEQFKKMKYCSAVINESLRLNTNAFSILRQAVVDTSIKDYVIPEGSGIAVSTGVIHRHPQFWKDRDIFIPERFLERPMGQEHLFAFIPFGAGKRACIARHFSPLEMLVVFVLIIRNYSLELPSDEPIIHKPIAPALLSQPSEDRMILRKL